jgi:hypothetical protein
MTSVDCAYWSTNYVNPFIDYRITSIDCTNFFVACSNKFDVCVNTVDDWANISIDLVDTLNNYFQISTSQILHYYNYHSRIC